MPALDLTHTSLNWGWHLGAGYTYNTNRSADTQTWQTDGSDLSSQTPKHLLKIWTSTRLPGPFSRWTAGGNLQAQTSNSMSGPQCKLDAYGNCSATLAPFTGTAGAFAVVGLRLAYQLDPRWNVALRVDNLLAKTYYESIGGPIGNNWYGEPRSVRLQVAGKFQLQ